MKKYLFLLMCLIGTLSAVCSCSPAKEFNDALRNATSDSVVTDVELRGLNEKLRNCLRKDPEGVSVSPKCKVASYEDIIAYLISEKGIVGDAQDIAAKCRKVGFKAMHIMLENSVSMKGYPGRGNPNFSDPVVALFHCGAEEYLTYYVGAKSSGDPSVKFDLVDSGSFLREIAHGQVRINTSSPIDRIISDSLDSLLTDDDEICQDVLCLITDGIISGTNAEIVANRDFTFNNLPIIENRVRTAFEKAYKRNLHCLIYRLVTPFEGVYYDYKNGNHPGFSGERPYFMIFVGDKDNLIKIEDSLKKEDYHYQHRLATYDSDNIQTIRKGVFKPIPGVKNVTRKGSVIEYKYNPIHGESVDIYLEMTLKDIPSFCFNETYLRDNLTLTYQDKVTSVEVNIPNSDWLREVVLDQNNKLCTMTVSIPAEYLGKMKVVSSMKLVLHAVQDEWYKEYSTLDDLNIYPGDVTTFGLERLVGGVLKGFNAGVKSQQNIIDYEFKLSRK